MIKLFLFILLFILSAAHSFVFNSLKVKIKYKNCIQIYTFVNIYVCVIICLCANMI